MNTVITIKSTEEDDNFIGYFKKIINDNTTTPPLIPPPEGSGLIDWLTFVWRNFIPFLIWILASIWICYIIFYHSRLTGFIMTKIINQFFLNKKNYYFHVGSFSLTAISGKIMFRDLVYVTPDYTIRVQDGWVIFYWWVPYYPKNIKKDDFSHQESRLHVLLNGLEVHIYNRTKEYYKLEKLFDLPSRLKPEQNDDDESLADGTEADESLRAEGEATCKLSGVGGAKGARVDIDDEEEEGKDKLLKQLNWRDLIPVTKLEVTSGRFIFGNNLIPSTLSLSFEESNLIYTSRPASSSRDLFTHIAKCKTENFKVILAPSPKYSGPELHDEPPRFMGDGFVVFQSNKVEFYYYQDEPGLAHDKPEQIQLVNGDFIEKFTSPGWGLDIKCGKGTDFSYGPWADRQREHLYNFFYPKDYRLMEVTKKSEPWKERRQFESFDIRLSTLADAKIDVLFSENKETNALHVNSGPGTYLEVTIPWVNQSFGYQTHITGQFLHLDATTSLQFRSLAMSETLHYDIRICYPRIWNEHQEWIVNLTGCKATLSLIFNHKRFFQSLIDDWSDKTRLDLIKFVPYTWRFQIVLKEFELLTLANEYNWIDCSSNYQGENSQLAVTGERFEMQFDLPFVEFLPENILFKIWIQGESLDASFYIPEANTHKDTMNLLYHNSMIQSRDGQSKHRCSDVFSSNNKWRNIVKGSNGWIDCWSAPIVALSISFLYWPIPYREEVQEEGKKLKRQDNFDPMSLDPDVITVELEVGPSVICLFGSLFEILWNLKKNYLGECQQFFDLSSNQVFLTDEAEKQSAVQSNDLNDQSDFSEINIKPFDERLYRPLEVRASATLHEIQGHLMKCCYDTDPTCPCLYFERLSFEMHKTYSETKLQLLISPILLTSTDNIITDINSDIIKSDIKLDNKTEINTDMKTGDLKAEHPKSDNLKSGYLTLSSLQFRGEALFSGLDRPLESETLEYGWLIEVQLGDITGRLTLTQTHHVLSSLETLFLHTTQIDCSLQPPIPYQRCLHDLVQSVCPHSVSNKLCPNPEDLKYRMVRVSVDIVDICFVESNVCLEFQLFPIKIATCNLHSCHTSSGFTTLINSVVLRQFVISKATKVSSQTTNQIWLEVSNVSLGTLFLDAANQISWIDNYTVNQREFLKTHDNQRKRLWFLWPEELSNQQNGVSIPNLLMEKCGCVGGCVFFGRNKNGLDFFNDKMTSSIHEEFYKDDIEYGESILHRGEYVLGIRFEVNELDDDDSLDMIMDSSFFSSLPSERNFKYELKSDDQTVANRKRKGFMRQLSQPARFLSPNIVSPTSLKTTFLIPSDHGGDFKQRSQSFIESGQEDGIKKHEISGRQLRTKSIDSSASERYFSVEDITSDDITSGDERSDPLSDLRSGVGSSEPIDIRLGVPRGSEHSGGHFKSSTSSDTIKSDLKDIKSSSTTYESAKNMSSSRRTKTSQSQMTSQSYHTAKGTSSFSRDLKSDSESTSSFISALSSQEELALVDLHNQMEKPILESPLLMSSYNSHLTQFISKNWDNKPQDQSLGQQKELLRRIKFKPISYGFSNLKVQEKSCQRTAKERRIFKESETEFIPGSVYFEVEKNKTKVQNDGDSTDQVPESKQEMSQDKTLSKLIEFKSEKLSILVKIENEIDIKLSPLTLEGLKIFIDGFIPLTKSLHPMTVISHLNLLCLHEVELTNQLKREKTLYLGQLHAKAWRTLIDRQTAKKRDVNSDTSLVANQLEQNKLAKIQAFVQIKQINLMMIQASIVEEVISFNALDNIKDLTCVSILTISLRESELNLSYYINQKKTLHTFMDQSSVSTLSYTEKALMSRFFSKKQKKELTEIESLTIETIDNQSEELLCQSKISQFHIQLSRLKNSSSMMKEAQLTVIPAQQSKVGFRFDKKLLFNKRTSRGMLQRQECLDDDHPEEDHPDEDDVFINFHDDELGFIMFESGIENVNIKVIKKSLTEVHEGDDGLSDAPPRPGAAKPDGTRTSGTGIHVQRPDLTKTHGQSFDVPRHDGSRPEGLRPDGQKQGSFGGFRSESVDLKECKNENQSSFVTDIESIWFNFAAPPKTNSNTRKIDYTRLDWHLLSTAAPSITAWLSVSDRFLLSLKLAKRLSQQRINGLLVSLMTAGLEVPATHHPPQSKHLSRQFTPLAKSLQDDPSCQLISALKRYLKTVDSIESIESELTSNHLPPVNDLKRGVVSLLRQWKNSLYMPLFIQQSMKLRKDDSRHPLRILLGEKAKQLSTETEDEDEADELSNEMTNLINEDVINNQPINNQEMKKSNSEELIKKRKLSGLRSVRGSIAFPLLSVPLETLGTGVNKAYEYLFSPQSGVKLDESDDDNLNGGANDGVDGGAVIASDHPPTEEVDGEENLYWWMARQQDYMKNVTSNLNFKVTSPEQDSKLNTLTSGMSLEDDKKVTSPPAGVSFLPTALQHGDVKTIFHPLIYCLSIGSDEQEEKSFLSFSKFGTKISVCILVRQFKIDIIESEDQMMPSRVTSPRGSSQGPSVHFAPNLQAKSLEKPAFNCDHLSIELDLRKVKDYDKQSRDKHVEIDKKTNKVSVVIVGPDGLNQITTLANFTVDISCISQRVKMPLVRLLHQFAAMYDSVKETRSNLHQFILPKDEFHQVNQDFHQDYHPKEFQFRERLNTESTSQTHSSLSVTMKNDVVDGLADEDEESDSETLIQEVRQPKCWKTMYYLLDLYETKPEPKTVIERNSQQQVDGTQETKIQIDEVDYKGSGRYEPLKEVSIEMDDLSSTPPPISQINKDRKSWGIDRRTMGNDRRSMGNELKNITNRWMQREFTPLVIFGVCKVKKVELIATMSGLQLDGHLTSFHVSFTHKQKSRSSLPTKRWHESSLTGQLGQTSISLLEESLTQTQQLVVKMTVGKSQTLISSQNKRGKNSSEHSALLTIGPIVIEIPQHPVALHGMMTRSTKKLSTTLQELRSSRQPSRSSRQQFDEMTSSHETQHFHEPSIHKDVVDHVFTQPKQKQLIKPIVVQFSIILDSFTIGAALLPSLKAQYQMKQVTSSGVTGNKAKFTIDLYQHTLSFNTSILSQETNLPSQASVDLPEIHVSCEYIEDPTTQLTTNQCSESFSDGIVLKQGNYLNAIADIGSFEHSLTTDLLNHLLLVQKVFMKEVNEVVQKMSGTDIKQMESLFGLDDETERRKRRFLLFSLHLRLKGIQITATTPTNNALRVETGQMELQLSNRVQNLSTKDLNLKLFIKLQVDLNVDLGQLIRNAIFEEAEPEFQQLAYFKTRIHLRNALQDELTGSEPNTGSKEDKEAVLITLNRPLIYIQPLALDKAVLVWLNYKNAYEYWNEQRANLNKEVLTATQQVLVKVQPTITQFSSQTLGTLLLQLTVDDLGACLPITTSTLPSGQTGLSSAKLYDSELKAAVVVTLEKTLISACSSGSLVSKAQFTNLCIRFADDFETSLDDWKPDSGETFKNLCVVSEGTYEICSRTIAPQSIGQDAKWLLNVSWKMDGFDIHVDTSIGKHFSALFKTLTALAGDEDELDTYDSGEQSIAAEDEAMMKPDDVELRGRRRSSLLRDFSLDTKKRSRLIEKELNEQAKIISDLRQLGATKQTIEQEVERLHELEAAVFQNFRRDVIKKLRRPSVRTSSFKEKLPKRTMSFNEPEKRVQKAFSMKESVETESPQTTSLSLFSETESNSTESTNTTSDEQSPASNSEFIFPDDKHEFGSNQLKQQSSLSEAESLNSSHQQTKTHQQINEPNIDFEFDVKIFFNSGKCVLHTIDFNKDDEVKKIQKERSFSGGPFELSSVSPSRSKASTSKIQKTFSGVNLKTQSSKLLKLFPQQHQHQDFTVFLIPGLDIKLHYNSKVLNEDGKKGTRRTDDGTRRADDSRKLDDSTRKTDDFNQSIGKKEGVKKGVLYAWMTLHSFANETLISPHILDFLEQALEPIPIPHPKTPTGSKTPLSGSKTPSSGQNSGSNDMKLQSSAPEYTAYASFPVDVIVYFHVQPTVVRFTCLPVSRVECLLQLPSIDLVFSSKRFQDDQDEDEKRKVDFESPRSHRIQASGFHGTGHASAFHGTQGIGHGTGVGSGVHRKQRIDSSSSGLSLTGCLADFSLYIFHPYGGQLKTGTQDNSKETSSLERKDSLSLQVEFVKVNISRQKRIVVFSIDDLNQDSVLNQSIKFSATCDIGSASFRYDMRRLTEILAFPKAWYRKSIWKRIFIGQEMGTVLSDDEEDISSQSTDSDSMTETPNLNSKRDSLKLNFSERRRRVMIAPPGQPRSSWETMILFSVNLSKLSIIMNMGNVMGNTNWLTRGLRSEGRVQIDSNRRKGFKIQLGLDGSTLDAKGGIVGGQIELSQISGEMNVREDYGFEPEHRMTFYLLTLQKRLDYMGTSVLMMRISDLNVTLKDEWRVDVKNYDDLNHPTKRPALIFLHGVLDWDQLQILMSKSTTPDIVKMYSKLEEFFSQQFHSSKRVFTSLKSRSSIKRNAQAKAGLRTGQDGRTPGQDGLRTSGQEFTLKPSHHRHWLKALRLASGLQLPTLSFALPNHGTILGGTVELKGQNISLACFYGINFRSKFWGTFSLREPIISFDTEAQNIYNESTGSIDTHVVQNLLFSLGRTKGEHKSMALVCRMARTAMFPPQFRHMNDWFHYAFSASEIDDVDRFPFNETELTFTDGGVSSSLSSSSPRDRRSSISPKPKQDYKHTKEEIFKFPSMQLELKTEHLQGSKTPVSGPDEEGQKTIVDCTFVSNFDDHIFVAVDAEAYFFLHELIISYIKEKESNYLSKMSMSMDDDQMNQVLKDCREFICHTWHLEPTVRLLSWAGKNIEPYGVDFILQRLGFSQARITIPKWIQRGAMDPLDKILSLVMFHIILANKNNDKL